MSLFKKRNADTENINKHILNIPLLDLRQYTPATLKNIQKLNAAMVILAKEPNAELMAAYGNIPCKNVATEIFVENGREIKMCNGFAELDCNTCDENAIYLVNGYAVIKNAEEHMISVMVNGGIICENGAKINIINCNGSAEYVDFKIKRAKNFPKDLPADKDFIENLEDGTVVRCGNNLAFELDVTPELLKGRKLYFSVGNTVKCSKRALGTVQTMCQANNYKTFV